MKNKILRTVEAPWRELEWMQAGLKKIAPGALTDLKETMKRDGFIQPFNAWERGGKLTILDGHHRRLALEELVVEGYAVPDLLPVNVIDCENEQEAGRLVLLYSSQYANMTEVGLAKFMGDFQLDAQSVESVRLPDVDLDEVLFGSVAKEVKAVYENAIQLKPQREYAVIVCEDGNGDWDELQKVLGLKIVQRGGYANDSPLNHTGIGRVVTARMVIDLLKGKAHADSNS